MNADAAHRAGRWEWIGLAVLALPTLLVSMDLNVLHLAVPALSADLRPSSSQLLWILDIYGFLIAGSLITMGTLGDRIGRRRLLLAGAAAFGVASVLAAFSTSAAILIATRALLGVAGATLMPSTLSLIRTMFHDSGQRTLAIAVWITSFMVGGAIGPLFGGALLEYFWWGSVFLLGVPVMVLLLVLGPVLLPESLTVGMVFIRRQRMLPDPLLDLRLFRVPAFSAALGAQTLGLFAMAGTYLFIVQYLQLVLGLSPLQAGLWTLPSTAGGILATMLAPVIVRRVRPAFVMGAGLAIAAAGFGALTQLDEHAQALSPRDNPTRSSSESPRARWPRIGAQVSSRTGRSRAAGGRACPVPRR